MLKGRPHNVDLILTEVDLPSISGFALLTLIMEHDICKNIPVIMPLKVCSIAAFVGKALLKVMIYSGVCGISVAKDLELQRRLCKSAAKGPDL
ncbi:hypothetical protein Gotur_013756 [Gossypium turneri]